MSRAERTHPTRWLAPLVAALLLLTPALASAAPQPAPTKEESSLKELQSKRNKVRSEKAARASKVDALKATDQEIERALADLSESVVAQTQAIEDAERGVQQAEADLAAATKEEADTAAALVALKASIKNQAIAAYVSVPGEEDWSLLSSDDPNDALNRKTLMEFQVNLNLDAAEDFRTLQANLAAQRQAKADAKARAEHHRSETKARLDDLAAAQARQAQFQDQVEARIERELSEAASLAELDGALSNQISSKQAAIAAQLAAKRRAAEAAQAALSRGGRRSAGGRGAPSGSVSIPSFTNGNSIVSVQGIRVHSSIAGNLDALLNAARAAGITLAGGGYRDPSGQIAVRRNNCGSSDYAIYQMPASSCRPPTARPGQSMHERGLAIDFTSGGSTLSRGSAAFQWLKANAASYGFYNLPSEPWHWSTNGN